MIVCSTTGFQEAIQNRTTTWSPSNKPHCNRSYPCTGTPCLLFQHRVELTVQLSAKSGAGVLSRNASLNTAEQNSSWDSCSLVDTIPPLHTTTPTPNDNNRQGEGQNVERDSNQAGVRVALFLYCQRERWVVTLLQKKKKKHRHKKRETTNASRSWTDDTPSLSADQKSAWNKNLARGEA